MTKRQAQRKLSPTEAARGEKYPGIRGKVVDFADHKFEESILYIRVRFMDKTELCWRINASLLLKEAELSDWTDGNFRPLKVFARRDHGSE